MPHAAAIAAIVGRDHVLSEDTARAYYASDLVLWEYACPPALVALPGTTGEVAAIARYAQEQGLVLVPRGAGLSYTGGVVSGDGDAIVLDLSRLDGVTIDAINMTVKVGAGLSWASLSKALAGTGLRPQQLGPISGEYSTIGGAVSQNVPGHLEGVLGLELVLADGTIATTGAGSVAGQTPFYRYFGPDLTGMFCGDGGVLGIKTAVTLRLVPERPAHFASFSFASPLDLVDAMARIGATNLGVRMFGMDPQKNRDAAKVDARTGAETVWNVVRQSRNPLALMRDLLQLARAPQSLADSGWTLHLTMEAPTDAAARSILLAARALIPAAGREIDNVLPKALHAKPYSVRGFVGREGERWVPIHGMVPLSVAHATMAALDQYFAAHAKPLAANDITIGYFFSSVGAYVSMEPMFYWRDALSPLHHRYLSERNRVRFADRSNNVAARAKVAAMREDVRAIFRAHGALHAQLARFYPYLDLLEPGTAILARRLKQALDPNRILNRGALDL
ncbi:FAD-binding oxidoreductase [Devosia ginsengisoli]|uniref:FAD-binding oxidoreductase n=1 Tax=Devosia ginsengisoli TaxID=400770 RepID=A0A5B8LW15_9HYPH|nr:FAD-binding oxidoreductase [Devosia ginsengisoli]QDZ11971.1 FAD-binding oxidoreductase [Devosia ginsengisoli]